VPRVRFTLQVRPDPARRVQGTATAQAAMDATELTGLGLQVAPRSYRAWRARGPSDRAWSDAEIWAPGSVAVKSPASRSGTGAGASPGSVVRL